ncbi:hypothetical protein [Brachybacterium sp. UMB0905]|uniref:hypothetical protein n=1 Tax=Brachybacterium sp. UMB0905 TaxID=2069310 RepID=UPI000C7FD503|nr:hypothetical protein [Brachybacterium sp. UMB0905]PMC76348.1 hypothetical protein CJ197_04100 [Brachybacterium sp. UMB0905]
MQQREEAMEPLFDEMKEDFSELSDLVLRRAQASEMGERGVMLLSESYLVRDAEIERDPKQAVTVTWTAVDTAARTPEYAFEIWDLSVPPAERSNAEFPSYLSTVPDSTDLLLHLDGIAHADSCRGLPLGVEEDAKTVRITVGTPEFDYQGSGDCTGRYSSSYWFAPLDLDEPVGDREVVILQGPED